jgi:hypothetical protein
MARAGKNDTKEMVELEKKPEFDDAAGSEVC